MTVTSYQTLHIIGLGVSQQAELSVEAQTALKNASLVIGSERQLQTIAHVLSADTQTQVLPKLGELKAQLLDTDIEGDVAVLASGDPLYYGIGRWFKQHFDHCNLAFYPAVSSIQTACHRLGKALQDVEVLSLHGRPLAKLKTRLRARQPLMVLTDSQSHPQAIAKLCVETGFSHARLTVLEQLGYDAEKVTSYSAKELAEQSAEELAEKSIDSTLDFDPLHLTYIEPEGNFGYLPQFPGIQDTFFITDGEREGQGMLTKREVRLQVLSLMQPQCGDVVWDIGAGCGGVAVELAYWQPQSQVYAIEHHSERFTCLEANRERFGVVSNLKTIRGRAPEALEGLPNPNRVFIGGSDGELPALLAQVWDLLPEQGVVVATAVTESSKHQLLSFYAESS